MFDFVKKLWKTSTTTVPNTSPANSVNSTDVAKSLRTVLMVGLSAALVQLGAEVSPEMLSSLLFFLPEGVRSVAATLLLSGLADLTMRFKRSK